MPYWVETLNAYGAREEALRLFDQGGPSLLPYATLVNARHKKSSVNLACVVGVYEWQNAPLMFIVDANQLESKEHLAHIRRVLALRGDAPYMGVVTPGLLEVYCIALDRGTVDDALLSAENAPKHTHDTLVWLGNQRPTKAVKSSSGQWVSDVILRLLTTSLSQLITHNKVPTEDAISLVGRALFVRFLADRTLLPPALQEKAASLFDIKADAQHTSAWLDKTFNGDLLPLADTVFDILPTDGYHVLGSILRRAPNHQLFLGWEEKWDNLDFSHIPVGILSQAYESFLSAHNKGAQKEQSAYYTPRPLADLMVRASLQALEGKGQSHSAKVLDPAAGAGVFLLTAFRHLVAARWRHDGVRPTTAVLRQILYTQITGFDVDESALRFAALGLYLLSIELDPDLAPNPIEKLRFENLRGTVLHRMVWPDAEAGTGATLGSLSPLVNLAHRGQYDVVVGNPPWTSGMPEWGLVENIVSTIATERGLADTSSLLPNKAPDLPFVWRAMEWAKPEGQIAFALHGRILFQQGNAMPKARHALFHALDVTSVINGAALRNSKVWPTISAPFCILIATNRKPHADAGFRFISPRPEATLNTMGAMRIDPFNSEAVQIKDLARTPTLLKVLFRGGRADLEIVERIRAQQYPTLKEFWYKSVGGSEKQGMQGSGNGYQKIRKSSVPRKSGDGAVGVDARYLHGMPVMSEHYFSSLVIDTSLLPPFLLERIDRPRSKEIFKGPLAIIRQSPLAHQGRISVAFTEKNVAYSETFYGYSPAGHPAAAALARYITLLLGSKLTLWWALMTSGKFGFEREVIEKTTLDALPFPDFDAFTPEQRQSSDALFEQLHTGMATWHDVDEWVRGLYGLDADDAQVITDTLAFNLPFAAQKKNAEARPSAEDLKVFCHTLYEELAPWTEGQPLQVEPLPLAWSDPWGRVMITTGDASGALPHWQGIEHYATTSSATEFIINEGQSFLLVGRLAQRRYWSKTHAKMLARQLIWSHIDMLSRETA